MKNLLLSTLLLLLFNNNLFAQSTLKGAENFSVKLPNNWTRTLGVNNLASVQWEHQTEEIYGYIIFENVDEMKIAELSTDLEIIADYALNDFNNLNQFKLLSSKKFKTTSGNETVQREFSYYDQENNIQFHMQINVFKTTDFIYKMINFGTSDTFKIGKRDIDHIINTIQFS